MAKRKYSPKAQRVISRKMSAMKGEKRPRKIAIALSHARSKGLKVHPAQIFLSLMARLIPPDSEASMIEFTVDRRVIARLVGLRLGVSNPFWSRLVHAGWI
jgi:hypothetical protein